jgi:hypothetical protein
VVNPPLTYTLGGLGLANGDILSGDLTTPADLTSVSGAYPILRGSLAASGDYAFSFAQGVLLVTPAPPAATLNASQVTPSGYANLSAGPGVSPTSSSSEGSGGFGGPGASTGSQSAVLNFLASPKFNSVVIDGVLIFSEEQGGQRRTP